MAKNEFPKSIKLGQGRVRFWDQEEIDAWIEKHIKESK
jgi:predicted DNA-binding transcriptional regulator AlpA